MANDKLITVDVLGEYGQKIKNYVDGIIPPMSSFVSTSGNQEISGNKTFNDDLAFKYTSTYYNANRASTANNCFGLYQWDNKFQFTYRNAATNAYVGTAFEIQGSNGLTDFKQRPTVAGSQVALKSDIPTSLNQYTEYAQNFGNLQNSLIFKDGVSGNYKRCNIQTFLDAVVKPNIPAVPTKTSDLTNDSGFITSADVSGVNNVITGVVENVATTSWTNTNSGEYPWRYAITNASITSTHVPSVAFDTTAAISGNFSPVCESYNGGIYVYAKAQPTNTVHITYSAVK